VLAGQKDYELPADRLAGFLDELGEDPADDRYARILAVVDAAGGEVG